ncbi:MAG: LCP family protein [Oscillospiraceae bacterium]|jgi:LCP family protein required for cell wall assembly|nr:LCP family protein [Oscillospiraceae bacterium]
MTNLNKDNKNGETQKNKKNIHAIMRNIAEFFRSIPGEIIAFVQPNGKLNPKRLAIVICSALLALLLLAGSVVGGIFAFQKDDGDIFDPSQEIIDNVDDFPEDNIFGVSDADSLNELLEKWATTGENAHSSNVINVLLIGVDSRGNNDVGRSDAMILASLNKSTKKITLVSFPRDSYTYMKINGETRFDKVNHSFVWDGPEALVPTLENDYKIRIDHWAYVNFVTFANVIDILGGVSITVSEAEAKEVNNDPRTYYGVKLTAGENVLLSGKQALAYSRIRHLGSDTARTERQRKIITLLIRQAKDANMEQVTKMASELLKSVKTDIGLTGFTNLGLQGITQGWAKFDVESVEAPENKNLRRGAYLYGTYADPRRAIALWIIDYPRAARDLQMRLYGQTNIKIDENAPSALDLLTPPPQRPATQPYVPTVRPPATTTAPSTTPPVTTSTPATTPSGTTTPPITTSTPPATTTIPPTTPPVTTPPPTTPPTTLPSASVGNTSETPDESA